MLAAGFIALAAAAAGELGGDLTITVIYDNNPFDERLETKWGFACLIRGTEKTILFDTGGDGRTLLGNMRKLGIDPRSVEVVFLSHIHGDHTGGLWDFLRENGDVTVYLLKSFPESFKVRVREAGAKVIEVDGPRMVCRDVYSTGGLGRWIEEQSLVIKTAKGLVVITGCAHPGVANIVKRAREIFHQRPYLVLGGFHLGGASAQRIGEIVDEMRKEGVKMVAPLHCSGDLARKLFKEGFGKECILGGVGLEVKVKGAFPAEGKAGVDPGRDQALTWAEIKKNHFG